MDTKSTFPLHGLPAELEGLSTGAPALGPAWALQQQRTVPALVPASLPAAGLRPRLSQSGAGEHRWGLALNIASPPKCPRALLPAHGGAPWETETGRERKLRERQASCGGDPGKYLLNAEWGCWQLWPLSILQCMGAAFLPLARLPCSSMPSCLRQRQLATAPALAVDKLTWRQPLRY